MEVQDGLMAAVAFASFALILLHGLGYEQQPTLSFP